VQPLQPVIKEDAMSAQILVPTDFSDGSEEALAAARELCVALGATLHVVHVVPHALVPGIYSEAYIPPPAAYFESLVSDAQARLEQWVPAQDKRQFGAVLTTRSGVPADEILARLSEAPRIDLVVMATHGRGGVARMMLGSVADQVVRHSPCPVMTVKAAVPRIRRKVA
jgi:nucleotide-binding universal stress UspA family protein